MKKPVLIGGAALFILGGGIWWSSSFQANDPNIISTNGIHWHPSLEIYVSGELLEIPHGVGLGAVHSPIHTHEDLPTLHLEFDGAVGKEDTKLKNFFAVWGKDFMEFGSSVIMTVNGEENTLLGEYEMQDDDVIVLNYE